MDAIQKAVVARIVKDEDKKEASATLTPGEYKGAFMARISYAFKRGEDFEKAIPAKAQPWKLLALALSKLNGVTIDALVRDSEAGTIGIEAGDIEARANEAMAAIAAKTVPKCNGQIRGKFDLDIVPTVDVQ